MSRYPLEPYQRHLVNVPLREFELKILRTALHYYEAEVMDPKNDIRFIDDPRTIEEDIANLEETIDLGIQKYEREMHEIQQKKGVAV